MTLRTQVRHARTGDGRDSPILKVIPNRNNSTQSPSTKPGRIAKAIRPGFVRLTGFVRP